MPSGGERVKLGDKCIGCGAEITERIAVYKGWKEYLVNRCKYCYSKHRDSVPSRTKKRRAKQYIEWKWGISYTEYERKRELQLNGCAICKQPCEVRDRLAVDHNHKTGVVRDLLCFRCNTVLGKVNEDEELLFAMIEYLKRHNEKLAS